MDGRPNRQTPNQFANLVETMVRKAKVTQRLAASCRFFGAFTAIATSTVAQATPLGTNPEHARSTLGEFSASALGLVSEPAVIDGAAIVLAVLFAVAESAPSPAARNKVRDVAVTTMKRAYGRAPDKLYCVGSSEGGREGLTMRQRYPADLDGVFSRVPVINWVGLQRAGWKSGLATMGDGYLSPAHVKLVHEVVLAKCDGLLGRSTRRAM